MLQLFELFQIFNELISLRRLSSTGGIEDVRVLSTNRAYVVGSSQVRGDFMHTRGILMVNLDRLRTQVQTVWIQHAARPHEHFWTTPYSRDFFDGVSPALSSATLPPPSRGLLPLAPEVQSREPNRGRPGTSFTASQPPLIFTQPLQHRGDTPYRKLHEAKLQTWPRINDPQGKLRHLCFACLFAAPFNQCSDMDQCGLRTTAK